MFGTGLNSNSKKWALKYHQAIFIYYLYQRPTYSEVIYWENFDKTHKTGNEKENGSEIVKEAAKIRYFDSEQEW